MKKLLGAAAAFAFIVGGAVAQTVNYPPPSVPTTAQPVFNVNPVTTTPSATTGNGTLATSTSSALINTMTVSSSGAALPTTLGALTVVNVGSTDAAFCKNTSSAGATCTCPENGAATTNGITILANGGGYSFNLSGVAAANPAVVACSGTPTLQFQW